MADINYINPMSIKPEIGWAPKNALAGMMYHQNEQDYRQMLGQQMRMQELGEQERRYDFSEKQAGAPLREMERQLKGETIQGQLPFARDVARSGAQTQMAGDEFKRKTEYSPERIKSVLSEYTSKMDKAEFDKFQREREQELVAIEQLMAAKKQFGDVYAVGQAKQLRERLAQAGIQTPQDFEDPRKWDFLYNSLMDSVKFTQEMKKVREQGDLANKGREITGEYGLRQTQINADARGRNAAPKRPSMNNVIAYVNAIEVEMSEARQAGDSSKMNELAPQYANALSRAFDERQKQMGNLSTLSPEVKRKYEAQKAQFVEGQLRAMGFREVGGGNPPEEPQTQSLKDFSGEWEDLGNGVRRRVIK